MRLDYWEHPLIVKAFRVRYRGGRLYALTTGYLMFLLLGGMLLYRYQEALPIHWARFYFVAMMGVQFFLSATVAASAVSSSISAEVTSRTLDFQRIAAISPLQILIGKVIGEPASSYLLAMATVPIGVFCSVLGGVTPFGLALTYVTLATTTFMIACVSVHQPLDPAVPGRAAASSGSTMGLLFFLGFLGFSLTMVLARGPGGSFDSLPGALVGLLTPMLTITELAENELGKHALPCFGIAIPYAPLAPLVQLGVAAFSLACMTRRLTFPLSTTFSKVQSYGFILVLDLLLAGLWYDHMRVNRDATAPVVWLLIAHTIVVLLVLSWCTPKRETYLSWIWRWRGRRSLLIDLLIGKRTLTALSLFVHCAIGLAVAAWGLLLPAWLSPSLGPTAVHGVRVGIAGAMSVLVILCYGAFYQVLCVTGGKGTWPIFFVVVVLGSGVPFLVGEYYEIAAITSLSPLAASVRLATPSTDPYPMLPFLVVHGVAILLWNWSLFRIARNAARQVDRKLEWMGIGALPAVVATG
jgi:hypothetical protein